VTPTCLLSLLLVSLTVEAAAPAATAEEARQQAVQLANGGRWDEALVAADRAVELAPDWAEALFIRAGIEAHAMTPVGLRELEGQPDSFAFRQYAVNLQAAARDLRRYIELEPEAPDRESASTAADAFEALAAVALKRQVRLDAQRQIENASTGKRLEAKRAEVREAKVRNLTVARGLGVGLVALSTLFAGGSILEMVGGQATNQNIRAGGFASGADQQATLDAGHNDNVLAIGMGLGAVVAVAGGTLAWILGNQPAPASPPPKNP
jgi:tetratricopeptide (TPR) repeat protein